MSEHDEFEGRHPRDRAIEPEDPMLLSGEPAPGDPRVMLDGLIEEYAGLGWDEAHIRRIFDTPFFQATWGLRQLFGPEVIEARIAAALARRGRMRFRTSYTAAGLAPAAAIPDILACPPPPDDAPHRDEGGP